jgi:hypothetical protein
MRYEFHQQGDQFIHTETGQYAGRVIPLKSGEGFSVHRDLTNLNECDKIGVVKSIDEALQYLTDYYVKNPPQWKHTRNGRFNHGEGYTMFTAFIKWTFYGVFTVEQQATGQWVVTCCSEGLLHHGQKAIFTTAEVAQYVVDRHERDCFSDYPALDDGYSWEGYRPLPRTYRTSSNNAA